MGKAEIKRCSFLGKNVYIAIDTQKIKDGNSNYAIEREVKKTCLEMEKGVNLITVCKPSGCICTGGRKNPFE